MFMPHQPEPIRAVLYFLPGCAASSGAADRADWKKMRRFISRVSYQNESEGDGVQPTNGNRRIGKRSRRGPGATAAREDLASQPGDLLPIFPGQPGIRAAGGLHLRPTRGGEE